MPLNPIENDPAKPAAKSAPTEKSSTTPGAEVHSAPDTPAVRALARLLVRKIRREGAARGKCGEKEQNDAENTGVN